MKRGKNTENHENLSQFHRNVDHNLHRRGHNDDGTGIKVFVLRFFCCSRLHFIFIHSGPSVIQFVLRMK